MTLSVFRLLQIRKYILLSVLFYPLSNCISQHPYTERFVVEITTTCPICSKNKELFNTLHTNNFHNAHVQFAKGNFDASYTSIIKLLNQSKKQNNRKRFILYVLKGHILKNKELFREALQNIDSAIVVGHTIKSPYVSNLYSISGQIHIELEKYQEAIAILEQWKTTSHRDTVNQRANFHNLGISYLLLEQYKKAEENLLESYRLNQLYKDTLGLARSSLDIAGLYYQQYQDSLAISYFEQGLDYAKQARDLYLLVGAYENLAVVEENREDYKKSLIYRREYDRIKDSIWNRDKIYEFAQQEKKVAVAVKEEQLKAEQTQKNLYRLLAGTFFLFLMGGGYFIYTLQRQKKIISRQKQHLNDLNDTKDTLFSILTHDLKTPIQLLSHNLFKLLQSVKNKGSRKADLIPQLAHSYEVSKKTALLQDNVLHWVLANRERLLFQREKVGLATLMTQVVYDYTPVLEERELQLSTHIDPTLMVLVDRNSLKVILRNILDNAIKFSYPKGKIELKAKRYTNHCTLTLIDFGKGFQAQDINGTTAQLAASSPDLQGKTSTGLGLRLCRQLLEKNKGTLSISSSPNIGTKVTILLQIYKPITL